MTSRDFCFWLRGYLESTTPSGVNPADIRLIQKKMTEIQLVEPYPSHGFPFPWVCTNTTDTILNPVPPGITVT